MKKIIEIPEEMVNYLQRLAYETDARSNLCAFMTRQGIKNEAFNDYHREYIEFYTKYELAKKQMEDDYIKPAIESNNFTWNLDFKTGQVSVDVLS